MSVGHENEPMTAEDARELCLEMCAEEESLPTADPAGLAYVCLWRHTDGPEQSLALYIGDLRDLVRIAEGRGWANRRAAHALWPPERGCRREVAPWAARGLARALRAALPTLAPDDRATPEMAGSLADFADQGGFLVRVEEF